MDETYKKEGVVTETSTTAEIGTADGKQIKITEYKNQFETEPSNAFTVSMTKWTPTAAKQSISLIVTGAGSDLSCSSSADWCTARVENNEAIIVAVKRNVSDTTARTATVTVTTGSSSIEVAVTQDKIQYGFLQPDTIELDSTAGSFKKLTLVGKGRWTTNHDHSLVRLVTPTKDTTVKGYKTYSGFSDLFPGYSGGVICEDGNLYADGTVRADGLYEQSVAVMALHDNTRSYSATCDVRFIHDVDEKDLHVIQNKYSAPSSED